MPRLPKLKGKELIKILGKHGFAVVRIKGSHHFLQHSDGRCTVVPCMPAKSSVPGYY
jgi:predicted RNA binding protein YcfA (HicA-like mRNA interferase family)